MTISKEKEADILRYYHNEKWPVGTICKQLSVHHDTVHRVLTQTSNTHRQERTQRDSMITPYLPFIKTTLEKYPSLCASRLYTMVKERNYPGGPDHFRHLIAEHRPRKAAEAFLRLKTLPGEQGQVDWGHFSHLTIGQAKRPLMAFVMVLSYSRKIFCRFYLNQQTANFLRGHVAAFEHWNGLPRVLLYDNLKSATIERQGDAIRFNPQLLEFAAHYHYEPRPVAVYRGNEKGRVERAIRYIRDNFFAGREFSDIDDLNQQALLWCEGQSSDRPCPEDKRMTVREAFEKERQQLLPLPDNPFEVDERLPVKIGKTPYARFDGNDYSIPHTHIKRTLTVLASLKQVRILDGQQELAVHPRSFDKGQQIEQQAHINALIDMKGKARKYRGQDRLIKTVPQCQNLLNEAALRGDNIGSITSTLLRYLDRFGQAELTLAVAQAMQKGVPHPNAVRQALQKRRDEQQLPPPVQVSLPDDKRVRELNVKPHDLSQYDDLQQLSKPTSDAKTQESEVQESQKKNEDKEDKNDE